MERGQLGSYWLELAILTLVAFIARSLRCVLCFRWKPRFMLWLPKAYGYASGLLNSIRPMLFISDH